VFTAGIPYWRFCVPLIFVGLFSAVFSFYFEDRVVIPSFKEKNSLSNTLLGRTKKRNNTDIVIKTEEGRVIYSVDYFNTESRTLEGLSIVEKDEEGNFLTIIRGTQAEWVDDHWEIHGATEYKWVDGILRNSPMMPTDRYREEPDVFLRSAVDVEELPAKEAKLLIEDLMQAGLPYIEARADYFHRYSFPATSIVVMLLSVAMGGRFKKNILLMSLLSSLMATVAYYVMEMISMMTAKLGLIPPALGAWFPVLGFILIGCLLLKSTRT
jgi:lipopolysaccharide export system permease protein